MRTGRKHLKTAGKLDQTYGHYSVMLNDGYKDNRFQSTGFMAGWGVGISTDCKDPVRAIKFLDFLASEQGQVLNNWGIEGKEYEMQGGKRVVPQDVQQRITDDNTAFSKETGIGFYTNLGAHYGDGAKDSTGNYYTKNFPEQIVDAYTAADKETLKAYGATTWMDLFPNEKDFPVKAWGAAWNIAVPGDDDVTILASKMQDISWKRSRRPSWQSRRTSTKFGTRINRSWSTPASRKWKRVLPNTFRTASSCGTNNRPGSSSERQYAHDKESPSMNYRNPVISGFHPDPSVCRVGEDYYLVTSSFEYFPGVPLFHSKDLVNWEQLGHVLTRPEQLDLRKAGSSGGIYAPTIRHRDGVFYMTTTNVSKGGNFFVHTEDPRGPWSDPVFVDQPGIDPDLFFDEDGAVYYTTSHDAAGQGAYQSRIDPKTGKRLSDITCIWHGTGGQYPEAPHIYRVGEWYYLLISEGGTEYGHMVTAARSRRPDGPFESCPHNPILSHRSLLKPIHATGHADLVRTPDGSWWAVFLGVRPIGYPMQHNLGRETFLAPVTWTEDGWPVIGDNGTIAEVMPAGDLPLQPARVPETREDFNAAAFAPQWTFLRTANQENWSLTEKKGSLTLHGSPDTLNDIGEAAFVGRRQQHFACRADAHLTFAPQRDDEEAGIAVYMNERFHYELAVTRIAGERRIVFRRRLGTLWKIEHEAPWPADSVVLTVQADKKHYAFGYSAGGEEPIPFGLGESGLLATEVAGGFTGVFIAMYATGNGVRSSSPAHFDWFDYRPAE